MAVASLKSRALIGPLNLSCYLRSFGYNDQTETYDVTTLCDEEFNFITGKQFASVDLAGPLDDSTSANGLYDILTDNWKTAALPVTFAPAGLTANLPVFMVETIETQIGFTSPVAGSNDWTATGEPTGPLDHGRSLVDAAAVTSDGSSASTDWSASSANGGVAHLHVTAFSGFTSDDIIIEHSTNDSVWATLGTFTQVTGLTSQRLTIAAGTTVNRYLRVTHDVDGSGSITVQVSFARR